MRWNATRLEQEWRGDFGVLWAEVPRVDTIGDPIEPANIAATFTDSAANGVGARVTAAINIAAGKELDEWAEISGAAPRTMNIDEPGALLADEPFRQRILNRIGKANLDSQGISRGRNQQPAGGQARPAAYPDKRSRRAK